MTALFETTDASEDATTLYQMAAGDVFFGTLATDEADWVRVDLVAGQTYSFAAIGLGVLGSGALDTDLILWAADGTELIRNKNGGPALFASLTYTPTTSGTYYVDLYSYLSGPGAEYGLSMTEGDKPSFGVKLAAAALYRTELSWAATPETAVTLTWAARATGASDLSPLEVLTATQVEGVTRALGNYSDVANLTFVQENPGGTSDNATILIGGYSDDSTTFAYASYPGSTDPGSADGDVWYNNTSPAIPDLPYGSIEYMVWLHELGHAMGLDHPSDYNGAGTSYATSTQFVQDSHQFTLMSYFDAYETEPASPFGYPATLMLFDIYAIQQLYGANYTTRAGDDTYGFNSNLGGPYDFAAYAQPQICIWDGAGTDKLDLSGFSADQMINLTAGQFSDVGGFIGNVSIAFGARIENARGGSGNDVLLGNKFDNVLVGGQGNDDLSGGAGKDRLIGSGGKDSFVFAADFGRDRAMDFTFGKDRLILHSDLWGGAALTATELVTAYAATNGINLTLGFGNGNLLTLVGVGTFDGLVDSILIL